MGGPEHHSPEGRKELIVLPIHASARFSFSLQFSPLTYLIVFGISKCGEFILQFFENVSSLRRGEINVTLSEAGIAGLLLTPYWLGMVATSSTDLRRLGNLAGAAHSLLHSSRAYYFDWHPVHCHGTFWGSLVVVLAAT
ncbi:hypothetical protein [Kitasatospora sp. NPDC005856]|uniref:hypothetical protein n=1 Tax=Kitasatospora sp. NPDC005856 TaxID=3154566 RepID=UPI0033E93C59